MVATIDRRNPDRRIGPAALFFAAFAVVWWLRIPGDPRPASPAGPSAPAAADTTAEAAAAADQRSATPGSDATRRPVGGAPAARTGVHVTVLDDDGAPVPAVPVELAARMAGSGSSASRFARAETDARGVAVLAADPERLRMIDEHGLDLEFEIRADVPLPDPPRAAIGSDSRIAEPVVLRIAAFGRADVRVAGPHGAPVDDGGPVYLFWRAPRSDGRWEREGIPSAPSVGGGRARFAMVPLGRELLFRATGANRFHSGEATVIGPTRAGGSVDVAIRLGPELPTVVGRLVARDGAPLADVKVSLGVSSVPRDAPPDTLPERSRIQYRGHTTDTAGRFRTLVHAGRDPDRRRVLAIEQDDSRSGGGEVVRRAVVPLDFALRGGADNDIGTVILVPDGEERVLVAGIVVDEDGAPLQGAYVSAGSWDREARAYRSLHHSRVRSGPDGRLEIRSTTAAPAKFEVSASAAGRVSAQVDATDGARYLAIALRRGDTLTAWIRVPDGVPASQIVGRIGDREPNQLAGRFGSDNLAAGRYDVTVRIRGTTWEIAHVRGVAVPAGGVADDPRLQGIEVACRALQLVVRRANGTPMSDARLWIDDEHRRGGSFETDADGRATVAVPAASATFDVHDGSGARAEVRWHAGEQTARLVPR